MTMTVLLPSIVTVLYALTSVFHLRKGNYALALVWGSYALANVGMIAVELTRK